MTTFDLDEVREFASDLDVRMNSTDDSKQSGGKNLDDTLRLHALFCREYYEGVREWGRGVFAGQIVFDPQVEQVWLQEGTRLYSKSLELLSFGEKSEEPCDDLDGRVILQAALWNLNRLLNNWVTPKLSVGPSARQGLVATPETAEEIRRRIEALPPLPADWEPKDPKQLQQFKRLQQKPNTQSDSPQSSLAE